MAIPDYALRRRIGEGSQGEVWLAQDRAGRQLALKVLKFGSGAPDRGFEREASALRLYGARLANAESVVRVHHVGVAENRLYYLMDLADSLAESAAADGPPPVGRYVPWTLDRELQASGRMSVERASEVIIGVLEGVSCVHRAGLLHRDIKPSNILRIGGRWKLGDIGLLTEQRTEVTALGTADYMPASGPIDRSADLYACGRVLYRMLTGMPARAFPALPPGRGLADEPEAPGLLRAVNRACDPDESRRFRSAEEFREAVLAPRAFDRRVRMRRGLRLIAALAALIGVAGALVYSGSSMERRGGEPRFRAVFSESALLRLSSRGTAGARAEGSNAVAAASGAGRASLRSTGSLGPGILRVVLDRETPDGPLDILYATDQPGGGHAISIRASGELSWARNAASGRAGASREGGLFVAPAGLVPAGEPRTIEIEWGARRHQIRSDGKVVLDLPAWVASGPVEFVAPGPSRVVVRRVEYAAGEFAAASFPPGEAPPPPRGVNRLEGKQEFRVREENGFRSGSWNGGQLQHRPTGVSLFEEPAMLDRFSAFLSLAWLAACSPGLQGQANCLPSFAPPMTSDSGVAYAGGIVTADLNRDGKLDLAISSYYTNDVSVMFGAGNGVFTQSGRYGVGSHCTDIGVGDFNGDGWPDLAVPANMAGIVGILLNNGNGTFADSRPVPVPAGTVRLAVADLNGDGRPDFAVTSRNSGAVTVCISNADGTFRPGATYASAADAYDVAAGDLDGDGDLDLVVGGAEPAGVSIHRNTGGGAFAPWGSLAAVGTEEPISVVVADLNEDGHQDVAVYAWTWPNTQSAAGHLAVHLGNGQGAFNTRVVGTALPDSADSMRASDLNGDGHLDLVSTNWNNNVFVRAGSGDGAFQAPIAYTAGTNASDSAVGDFNGDGRPDLAIANNGGSGVCHVFLNTSQPPVPVSLAVTPDAAVLCPSYPRLFTATSSAANDPALGFEWEVRLGGGSWQPLTEGVLSWGDRVLAFVSVSSGSGVSACTVSPVDVFPYDARVRCRVSSPCGSVVSVESVLTALPDLYFNGSIDTADLVGLISKFGYTGVGLREDLNADGVVDTADLIRLLGRFGENCG